MLVRSLTDKYRPVAVHLIPTRRCNLSCRYCNEYDDHSAPVPTADMLRRVDHLVALGAGIVTLSGGEPLLHPELDAIVRHIRRRGVVATLITNGYLLSRDRIRRLNRSGLDHLQISIDNLRPDEVSKKSLKLLDQKLQWLSDLAEFDVTVNSVVGSGIACPEDALAIMRRARDLGFSTTIGIVHDGSGGLRPLADRHRAILERAVGLGGALFDYANYNRFQKNLADGRPNDWHCRAGARYLYVCEDGLVHWCSQQRGRPGVPLERYTPEHLREHYDRVKACAPFCTVGCVHRVAQVDELRQDPIGALSAWFAAPEHGEPPRLPLPVRALVWAFVTSSRRELFRSAAAGLFGAGRQP